MWATKVLVGIFGIGTLCLLSFEFGVLRLESVGDVLEKNQSEDDVLVLCRVHVIAQRVRRSPQLRFKTQGRTICQGNTSRSPGEEGGLSHKYVRFRNDAALASFVTF